MLRSEPDSSDRPHINIDEVATGDAWLAGTSIDKNLGLVDELRVSSDYLLELNQNNDLIFLTMEKEKTGIISQLRKMSHNISHIWQQMNL